MKKINLFLVLITFSTLAFSQKIIHTFHFDSYQIVEKGNYQIINFDECLQTAKTGEPILPYKSIKLLLPQGAVAENVNIYGENLTKIEKEITLFPRQKSRTFSSTDDFIFEINDEIYSKSNVYPEKNIGNFETQFMNGYSICLSTFTPVVYNPVEKQASYYQKVTIEIEYSYNEKSKEICENVKKTPEIIDRVSQYVQNEEEISKYTAKSSSKENYDILVVTDENFIEKFSELVDYYSEKNLSSQIKSISEILLENEGIDDAEKLRNYIIQQYNDFNISYLVLAGDVELIPYRGFYCSVQSSLVYEDEIIPSDLYFSSLDGTWNDDNDNLWGEIGEDDLLPEISVGRMPFSNQTELENMLNKTLSYQQNPIENKLNNPILVGEHLWNEPETWGADYLDLLVGFHDDNGYETTGIPETAPYETLYERDGDWSTWEMEPLFSALNDGHSFIYHSGHANADYVMGLSLYDFQNYDFSLLDGENNNFTFLYTHGCICGSFDIDDCIAEKMVTIENFLVGFIGNSRFGWFNEGQTEGPSAHIQREFVDALYEQEIKNIGKAHMISKMNTAEWVNAPGQWEEGALRWCFYDCNVLADPVLAIYTENIEEITDICDDFCEKSINIEIYPNPSKNIINIYIQDVGFDDYSFEIYDISGKIIHSETKKISPNNENIIKFDISNFEKGIYLIDIQNDRKKITKKILKI